MYSDRRTGEKGTDSRATGEIQLTRLESYVGAKEQKSPGTTSRCDSLRQGWRGDQDDGFRDGGIGVPGGSLSGDVWEVLHLYIGNSGQSSAWRR